MNIEKSPNEKEATAFETFKKKLSRKELRRLVTNSRDYIRSHPGTTLVASLAAGFALGYVAKTIAARRHPVREIETGA